MSFGQVHRSYHQQMHIGQSMFRPKQRNDQVLQEQELADLRERVQERLPGWYQVRQHHQHLQVLRQLLRQKLHGFRDQQSKRHHQPVRLHACAQSLVDSRFEDGTGTRSAQAEPEMGQVHQGLLADIKQSQLERSELFAEPEGHRWPKYQSQQNVAGV